ncbi:MAG: amidohydrolase family protein [Syntrophaceae bacterium]|nr:amidohydrolase family protein [Syntrophaceae bacterium]
MKYYDVHIHFFYHCSLGELKEKIGLLEKTGLAGMNILVICEFPTELNTYLKMIPGAYHPYVTQEALENQKDPFAVMNVSQRLRMIPFLDARFMENNIEEKIKMYRQKGFEGLKLLYVPEEDRTLNIGGMEKTFGRTLKQSEKITSLIVENASSRGMPVLIHVDLRKYGNFIAEMIGNFSRINFNIPHFGFSRRAISSLLDQYPNCYTDMSSLVSFMEKDPVSYRRFIQEYQDRILFGSDAVIGQPETVQSTINFLSQFLEDEIVFNKLINKNYMNYMGFE